MTIFAIMMPQPQPGLVAEVEKLFPNDFIMLSDTQYLVSFNGTAVDLCAKLGIYNLKEKDKPASGVAVVFATSSYFGRGPATVWDWLKTKLEATPNV